MPHKGGLGQLTSQTLSQRIRGSAPDLGPSFQAQRGAVLGQLGAGEETNRRRLLEDAIARGSGRTGATTAGLRGIGTSFAGQRAGVTAQLGLRQQAAEQSAIENALRLALQQQQIGISEEQLELQRQLTERQTQGPSLLELLGLGGEAAASLFGPGGGFPGLVPGIGKAISGLFGGGSAVQALTPGVNLPALPGHEIPSLESLRG